MHTTRAVPSKQDLQTTLNTTGVFDLITDDRFIGTLEAHLPQHRERTYPPVETLAMFVAQDLSDDSSCQRAVNERIVRCLQQGMRPSSTSTAAYCEARVRLPSVLVKSLYKAGGKYVSDNAPSASLWCKRRALFIQPRVFLTTLTDRKLVSDKQIVKLYLLRWNVETDFRSLKCALEAGLLTCRTADMIKKELSVHLLAYNLTRLLMNEAATHCGREPRSISFRHTVQLWSAWSLNGCQLDAQGWAEFLRAIAGCRVGNRPGRKEPRAVKRRPKPRPLMDMPRPAARACAYRYER